MSNEQIKIGERVKSKHTGEYLGQVIGERTIRVLAIRNAQGFDQYGLNEDDVEIADRLTPDQAWAELPFLVVKLLNTRGPGRLLCGEHAAIRHECYKFLGGAGIKIEHPDGPNKQRVRQTIERFAEFLNIEIV